MAIELIPQIVFANPEGDETTRPISQYIPQDLYRTIVQCVNDDPTLLALCLTSHAFRVEAERILYESMTGPWTTRSATSHIKFLQTVANAKRLAILVRTYRFPYSASQEPKLPYHVQKSLPWLLRQALQEMINLRELWLGFTDMVLSDTTAAGIGAGLVTAGSFPFILNDCRFELETLHIAHCVDARAFCSFLAGQRRMRKLTVYFYPASSCSGKLSIFLPATACPNLDVLQGNRGAIDILLPNRNISTLLWDPDMYDMNRSMPHLSEALKGLKSLSLEGCYLRPSLQVLSDYLKSLECLELVTLHTGELDVMGQIPTLRALILTEVFSYNTWAQRGSTVSRVFSGCRRLEFIAVQSILFEHSPCQRLYECWIVPCGSNIPVVKGVHHKEAILSVM